MENNKNGGFQFWPNYYKAIKRSSCPEKFALAIVEFFYEGTEHQFSNEDDQFLFELIAPSIKCSKRNSERRQNGGGARPGNNYNPNGRKGKAAPEKPAETPTAKEKEFVPPTPSEVAEYVRQYGPKDPEGFAIYYIEQMTNNGWKYGKKNTPVKNWKNNVQQWLKYHKDEDFSYLKPNSEGQRKMVNFDFDKLT